MPEPGPNITENLRIRPTIIFILCWLQVVSVVIQLTIHSKKNVCTTKHKSFACSSYSNIITAKALDLRCIKYVEKVTQKLNHIYTNVKIECRYIYTYTYIRVHRSICMVQKYSFYIRNGHNYYVV